MISETVVEVARRLRGRSGASVARHQQLSRPLLRRRLQRRLTSMGLGLLLGLGVSELLAQFGSGWFHYGSWPWWGGIVAGLAISIGLSMTRWLVGQLRIQLAASRAGFLSVLLIAGGIGLAVIGGQPAPAAAQDGPACDVNVSGPAKTDGPDFVSDAGSPGSPIVVDPRDGRELILRWNLPADTPPDQPMTMTVRASIPLRPDVQIEVEAENSSGVYSLRPATDSVNIAPGVYSVDGQLTSPTGTICPSQRAYVRVAGNPLSNPFGWAAIGGSLAGAAGLAYLHRPRFDLWTFTTPDRVTVDIINPKTGKVARGGLVRGGEYTFRTTIEFPDPVQAYQGLSNPVHIGSAVLGSALGSAAAPQQLRTIDPAKGETTVDQRFVVPTVGETMRLVADLSVGGNIVQSLRITESLVNQGNRMRVPEALGQVVYKAGSWSAQDLLALRPTDATVMMHGIGDGQSLETWVYRGSVETGRKLFRSHVSMENLAAVTGTYRRQMERVIRAGWKINKSTAGRDTAGLDKALLGLAGVGCQLRTALFNDLMESEDIPYTDAIVLVAHDTEVTGSTAIPWSGLYNGAFPAIGAKVCYSDGPESCADHEGAGGDVVCVAKFWSMAYELAWPNGWVPSAGISERPGFAWLRRMRGPGRLAQRLVPNLIDNTTPPRVHHGVHADFIDDDRFAQVLPRAVDLSTSAGLAELLTSFDRWANEAEIVHLLGHGNSTGDFSMVMDDNAPALDEHQVLNGVGDQTLVVGPLVFLNACRSGTTSTGNRNGLADAFRQLGARAVVVTESRVLDTEATEVAGRIVTDLLAGRFVARAVLEARRRSVADFSDLSALSYTYYGPPGLCFKNPLVDIDQPPPGPTPRQFDPDQSDPSSSPGIVDLDGDIGAVDESSTSGGSAL